MKANAVISGAMNNRAASSGFQTEMTRYRLGNVADVIVGYPFDGHKYSRDGVPVVRGENVTIGALRWDIKKCWNEDFPLADEYSLQDEDIVIGMDGSRVGRNRAQITMQDLPLLLAQRVACVRAKAGLYDQSFLYYQIFSQSFESYVNTIQSGSAVPHISQKQIEDFPVSGLDFTKQRVIGKFLSALDRKIALNRRKIATLEKMAKEIYDYWFVQYDFPDANGRPYKSSGGEMVYSPELKREIPKGWKIGSLADIAQYPQETVRSDTIDVDHYVTTDSLLQEKLGRTQASNLPPVPVSLVAFQKADTLVANIRPYLKKIWYASENGGCSQDVLVFHPINNELAPLLHSILWQDAFFDYVMAAAKGSKMPRGDKAHIMAYPISLPDKSVIRRFGEVVEKFYAWRECALKETASLTALRDFLLPLLMNGQVRIGGTAE